MLILFISFKPTPTVILLMILKKVMITYCTDCLVEINKQ